MIIYTGGIIWILLVACFCKGKMVMQEDGCAEIYATRLQTFLSIAYLVFFIGLRSAGADTAAYIHAFEAESTGLSELISALTENEGLFAAFQIAMKTFVSTSYYPYLFSIALISGWAIANTLRRYTPFFTSAMLLFMLMGDWCWMINGIRQFLAVSLSFSAIGFLLRKNIVTYILVILVLSKIHTSVLLLIPICFLVYGEAFSKKTLLMIAVALFAVFFTSSFLDTMETVLEDTVYAGVLESEYFIDDDGSNPIRTLIFAVPVILSFLDRENIRNNAPPIIHVCVNMSIICVCVSAIANVTSGIFAGRLSIYFSLYNLILLPWLAHNVEVVDSVLVKWSIFLLYGLYYVYSNYITGGMYYYSELLGIFIR